MTSYYKLKLSPKDYAYDQLMDESLTRDSQHASVGIDQKRAKMT